MITAKEFIEQNIELLDDPSISFYDRFIKLKAECPAYILDDVLNMLRHANIDFPEELFLKGITSDATPKEMEFYEFAKSLGYTDAFIYFRCHGVSIENKDVCVNLIDHNDGTMYVYVSQNVKTGYADSRKLSVTYRKVKTILKRGAEGYELRYIVQGM